VDERVQSALSEQEDSEDEVTSSSSLGSGEESVSASEPILPPPSGRKRKQNAESEDIEGAYMRRLMREDDLEERKRQLERNLGDKTTVNGTISALDHNGMVDASEDNSEANASNDLPVHESLSPAKAVSEQDKTARTIFLGNVSTQAIKSKSDRKILLSHLSKFLKHLPDHGPPHKIESLRFRSTAYDVTVGPKRAAFAKKGLMDTTTKSTNAYVVYSTQVAAKKAVSALNGTIVLDRHLRADRVSQPSKVDQRRCIFVGNLGFVDEETVDSSDEEMGTEGNKQRGKKGKEPRDAEEGLWRTFGKVGTVESVRVIRDKSTRIGKGIAYVQFEDENAVEAALLYNDKKFPPMLPRKLRVSRARKIKKRDSGVLKRPAINGTMHGLKHLEKTRSFKPARGSNASNSKQSHGLKRPGTFVFEGYRASSSDGKRQLKSRGEDHSKNSKGKPTTRSSHRGAAFKAGGKKKGRDKV
jgi:nucleolar protein 12